MFIENCNITNRILVFINYCRSHVLVPLFNSCASSKVVSVCLYVHVISEINKSADVKEVNFHMKLVCRLVKKNNKSESLSNSQTE